MNRNSLSEKDLQKSAYFTDFEKESQKEVKRNCLKCGREFTASNKYNRICYNCKKTDDYMSDNNYYV